MFHSRNMKRWWLWLIIGLVLVAAIIIGVVLTNKKNEQAVSLPPAENSTQTEKDSAAIAAGKQLSNNNCSGSGPKVLTRLPMEQSDFSMILPYGLMVGGHVTPVDHQYFSPIIFNSPRDTYPVYAMADAKVVDIQPRTNNRGTEYRFVFSMSCTFLYYYDLVTSLAPDIKTHFDNHDFNFDVKAGDLVGKIGGQTLDFAVWDTEKPLKNFINPTHYIGEAWKIYTADPLDYYSPAAKANALAKYVRTALPLSGRIDYDIDGKLIGTWFQVGTNGYAGVTTTPGQSGYWSGHLSVVPEYIDNTALIVSFGSWNGGEAKQFVVKDPVDPKTVGVDTGIVRYELYQGLYKKADGSSWDSMSFTQDPKFVVNSNGFAGCVIMQLTDTRLLKVEQFQNKKCGTTLVFSDKAKTYER